MEHKSCKTEDWILITTENQLTSWEKLYHYKNIHKCSVTSPPPKKISWGQIEETLNILLKIGIVLHPKKPFDHIQTSKFYPCLYA